jgi:hypothetical protein
VIRTLEKVPDAHDDIEAANDGEAELQLKLDLQIPAVACWIRHNGQRLHDDFHGLDDWNKRDIPSVAMPFTQSMEHWTFWQKRYVITDRQWMSASKYATTNQP